MSPYQTTFQLGMELSRDEPGVIRELNNLHQVQIGIDSTENHSVIFELFSVIIIHFVAVAMTLSEFPTTVCCEGSGSGLNFAGISPQTHGSPHIRNVFLILHEVYNRVWGFRIEFRTIGSFQTTHTPSKINNRTLQAQTDAEKRYLVFAGDA
jgi:hypothetical protein